LNLICVAKYVPVPTVPKLYGAVTVPGQIYARELHEKGKLQILNIACYTEGISRFEQGKKIKFDTVDTCLRPWRRSDQLGILQ
jgi:hypothetical protein